MFTSPVKTRAFAKARGTSYHSVRREVEAGILETVQFPDGERIATDCANRVLQEGYTDEEIRQYRKYHAAKRKAQEKTDRSDKACVQCGEKFTPKKQDQIYCSSDCRLTHYKGQAA